MELPGVEPESGLVPTWGFRQTVETTQGETSLDVGLRQPLVGVDVGIKA